MSEEEEEMWLEGEESDWSLLDPGKEFGFHPNFNMQSRENFKQEFKDHNSSGELTRASLVKRLQ